jgi:rhomboid protease GluP
MGAWTEDRLQAPRPGGAAAGAATEPGVTVAGVPWLTLGLLLSCIWVLAAAGGLRSGLSVSSLLAFGAKATPLILDRGETWRFFSANLLHKDLLHFAFNAFAIWNVGGPLERAVRPADYLALLLATALGTTIASAVFADSISLGASGIAFGLLGAAAAFGWRRGVRGPLKAHFGLRLLPWLFALFAAGLGSAGVDNWGHGGGLVTGAALGFFLAPRTEAPEGALRRLAVALGALAGALALGMFAAPSLPLLGGAHEGPAGTEVRFPVGWRRAESGPERTSYTNGLVGGYRNSATLWSLTPRAGGADATAFGKNPSPCRGGAGACNCAHADALVRAIVEADLWRLADVGALHGVTLAPPEPLHEGGAGGATIVRGAAQGADGDVQVAAVCTQAEGVPSALIVFMPPGSAEAAGAFGLIAALMRTARRSAAAGM